jgi:hypothetical protein
MKKKKKEEKFIIVSLNFFICLQRNFARVINESQMNERASNGMRCNVSMESDKGEIDVTFCAHKI